MEVDSFSAVTRAKGWLEEWSLKWRAGPRSRGWGNKRPGQYRHPCLKKVSSKKCPYVIGCAAALLLSSLLFCFVMLVIKLTSWPIQWATTCSGDNTRTECWVICVQVKGFGVGRTTENLLVSHSECEEEVQGGASRGQGRKDRVPPGRGFWRRVMRVTTWSQQWGEVLTLRFSL